MWNRFLQAKSSLLIDNPCNNNKSPNILLKIPGSPILPSDHDQLTWNLTGGSWKKVFRLKGPPRLHVGNDPTEVFSDNRMRFYPGTLFSLGGRRGGAGGVLYRLRLAGTE